MFLRSWLKALLTRRPSKCMHHARPSRQLCLRLEPLEDRLVPTGLVYNLADDWSDVVNPNGVWTYEEKPGQAITSHLDNWLSGLPAWAHVAWPNGGHIPAFWK